MSETIVFVNGNVENAEGVQDNENIIMAPQQGTEETDLKTALDLYRVTVTKGSVTSNIPYIKRVMQAKRDGIKNTVYAGTKEDQLAMIKGERAAINKFREKVKKEKKSVKDKLLESYSDFENNANEVIALADETYNDLNERAAVIEEERREEKRKQIREYYDSVCEVAGDFAGTLYTLIYQTEWENSSTTMAKIKKAIGESVNAYVTGADTLSLMVCDADIKDAALIQFKEDLNITKAVQYIASETNSRAEAKAREEARIAEERARIKAEEEAKAEARIAAEKARIEAEAKEKEKARIVAEKARIAAEKVRIEAEYQEKLRAEKARMKEEQHNKTEEVVFASVQKAETNNFGVFSMPEFLQKQDTKPTAIIHESVESDMPTICVEFLSLEDWDAVKEYCDLHKIFYREK